MPSRAIIATIAGREWYAAALILGLAANAAMALSQHHAGRGMMTMARATAVPAERVKLTQIAFWHAHRSGVWGAASIGLALAMILCWSLTPYDRKRGLQGVLVVLAVTYVLNSLLMV